MDTQINSFYPVLAYLIHLIEPLTSSTAGGEDSDMSSSSLPDKVLITLHKELLLIVNNLNK